MDEFEEKYSDPDTRLLAQLHKYSPVSGYNSDGTIWELSLYHEGDTSNGRKLIDLKNEKVWLEIREAPLLPVIPLFPAIEINNDAL